MSKTAGDDQNVTTSVRMSPDVLAELKDTAKREKRTQSAIIEAALEEYFQRNERTDLPDELVIAVQEYLERHRQPKKSK